MPKKIKFEQAMKNPLTDLASLASDAARNVTKKVAISSTVKAAKARSLSGTVITCSGLTPKTNSPT